MVESRLRPHLIIGMIACALVTCALCACVPSNAPETHRIPLKEELESQGNADAPSYQIDVSSTTEELLPFKVKGEVHLLAFAFTAYQPALEEGFALARGEKKHEQPSQAAQQQAQDKKDEPQEPSKPGKAYIDATSPEDRAIAAKAATSYITEQTDSRLDKLLLTPDDTYHFWRVPAYLKDYDKPGSVLIYEAYCNGGKTPDVVLLIKEADHVWTVKIFNTQQEYDELFKQ